METTRTRRIRKLVVMAMLTALVIVLQLISILPINPVVGVTFALTPIVIGAILYGEWAGALLGAVMGIEVFIMVVTGQAGSLSTAMFQLNPVVTFLVCVLKTAIAGFLSGWLYSLLEKTGKKTLAAIVSALVCPVVNTGLFLSALLTVFYGVADKFAEGSMVHFVFIGILGVNFILEFVINSVASPAIARIVQVVRKNKMA